MLEGQFVSLAKLHSRLSNDCLRSLHSISGSRRFRALCVHWRPSLWPEAIKHLQEALRLAEVIAFAGELWLIHAVLGELYLKQDEIEQSICGFGQAAAIVRKQAVTLRDHERRANFLASPLVRRLPKGHLSSIAA